MSLQGRLLVCDNSNHRIRAISLIDAKFTVSTLIGNGESENVDGPADKCSIDRPAFIVSDAAGNLFITTGDLLIRVFIAATGTCLFLG